MASTVASSLHGLGISAKARRAQHAHRPAAWEGPGSELLSFVRALHVGDWRGLSPLVLTALFAAILAFIAGASPATLTVRRMIAEQQARDVSTAVMAEMPASANTTPVSE